MEEDSIVLQTAVCGWVHILDVCKTSQQKFKRLDEKQLQKSKRNVQILQLWLFYCFSCDKICIICIIISPSTLSSGLDGLIIPITQVRLHHTEVYKSSYCYPLCSSFRIRLLFCLIGHARGLNLTLLMQRQNQHIHTHTAVIMQSHAYYVWHHMTSYYLSCPVLKLFLLVPWQLWHMCQWLSLCQQLSVFVYSMRSQGNIGPFHSVTEEKLLWSTREKEKGQNAWCSCEYCVFGLTSQCQINDSMV